MPKIQATNVSAGSQTTCARSSATASIATLTIDATPIALPTNPPPNTRIQLAAKITVTINEQTPVPGGLLVNAVHITSPTIDTVIASARSDIHNCL